MSKLNALNALNAYTPPAFEKNKVGGYARKKPSFAVHPLFLLAGVFYACTGNLLLFLGATLVAVQHEFAHAVAAAKRGYRLNKILLMPYGAVIDGDLKGLSVKDELSVALAGPICNLCTAVGFLALWWCFPVLYPFTDTAFYLSLTIGLVNLLPAYPLDGGRILNGLLTRWIGEEKAKGISKTVGIFFSLVGFSAFLVLWINGKKNLSLGVFSAFVFFGNAQGKNGRAFYEKICYSGEELFLRGAEIKRVAISENFPVKNLPKLFEKGKFLVAEVYDKREEKLAEFTQKEIAKWFEIGGFTAKISDFIEKRGKKT
ncbi:MAG: site-2 protease family protein [Clostridia bacterium]|nr:site-2 protease family protein [Clostridia bacterium]